MTVTTSTTPAQTFRVRVTNQAALPNSIEPGEFDALPYRDSSTDAVVILPPVDHAQHHRNGWDLAASGPSYGVTPEQIGVAPAGARAWFVQESNLERLPEQTPLERLQADTGDTVFDVEIGAGGQPYSVKAGRYLAVKTDRLTNHVALLGKTREDLTSSAWNLDGDVTDRIRAAFRGWYGKFLPIDQIGTVLGVSDTQEAPLEPVTEPVTDVPGLPETAALAERIADAETRAERAQQAERAAETRAEEAERALEEFKIRVHEVATQEAIERDWCGEIDTVLRRLDLPPVRSEHSAAVRITLEYRVKVDARDSGEAEELIREDLRSSAELDPFRTLLPDSNQPSIEVDYIEID